MANTAVKGFEGWDTAPGLKKVADTWDRQVTVLMGRLGSEKSAVRGASGRFIGNDIGLGDQFRPIGQSKLNGLWGVAGADVLRSDDHGPEPADDGGGQVGFHGG
ncbi:hypothetical protein ACIQU4_07490 [Streptomyces sp. NPDC090741]|uniref:hypothetical protein n=1 Tax=Streptomyces sp. NPDC090741 TaxID=3365967 RepID=UPI00381D9FFB